MSELVIVSSEDTIPLDQLSSVYMGLLDDEVIAVAGENLMNSLARVGQLRARAAELALDDYEILYADEEDTDLLRRARQLAKIETEV